MRVSPVLTQVKTMLHKPVADPGFAKGGGDMASMQSLSLNGDLEAQPLVGGPGGRRPPEAESFLYIFIQKRGQQLRI